MTVEGKPYHASLHISHVQHDGRSIPRRPLGYCAVSRATFSIDVFNAVASNVRKGIQFKGIAYENERPNIIPQLPCGGADIQDGPVYWTLHDGRVVCWSVRRLAEAKDEDLEPADSIERYKAMAKELGYDVQSLSIETRAIDHLNNRLRASRCRSGKLRAA